LQHDSTRSGVCTESILFSSAIAIARHYCNLP